MSEKIRIVEKEGISIQNPVIVEGFPDVGLVGAIAASHLIDIMKLDEVAHIESRHFPPIMVLHKGVLKEPIRIHGKKDFLVVMSEVAISPSVVYDLSKALGDFFEEKKARLLISLTGFPVQNRVDITSPVVHGAGTGEEGITLLKENGIDVMQEGFVAGLYALLLKECMNRKIPAIALLAQSFLNYPDPGAAASALSSLNKILKMSIDVKPLLEKADEIRVSARDLMKQAQRTMGGMQKMAEQEMPLIYR